MSDRDPIDDGADEGLDDDFEELLVVPPRRGTSGALMPAVALILVALAFLVYRSSIADWRGFEPKSVVQAKAAPAPLKSPAPAPVVAKRPVVAAPNQKPKPAPAPTVAQADPMAEIAREAERKRQEKEELEKLKDDAAKALADAPRVPRWNPPGIDPLRRQKQFEAMARHQAQMDRMLADFRQRHDQMFNEAIARHREFQRQFAGGFPRPRGMPFGDMADDSVPLPPVPHFPDDGANDRQVRRQRGTFILPGGGQGQWQSTIIIIQGADGGFRH